MSKKQSFEKLKKDYPNEVPLIEKIVTAVTRVERSQDKLECQIKALIKYNRSCATAVNRLFEDLKECDKR